MGGSTSLGKRKLAATASSSDKGGAVAHVTKKQTHEGTTNMNMNMMNMASTDNNKSLKKPTSVNAVSGSGKANKEAGKSLLLRQVERKVVQIIQLNGGKIKTKQLSKQIKKEIKESKTVTKELRAEALRKAVLTLC